MRVVLKRHSERRRVIYDTRHFSALVELSSMG